MNKYILEIEFRFNTIPTTEYVNGCNSRKYSLSEGSSYEAIKSEANCKYLEIIKRLGGENIEIQEGDKGVFCKLDEVLRQETVGGYIRRESDNKRVCRFFLTIKEVKIELCGGLIEKFVKFLKDEVTHPDDI